MDVHTVLHEVESWSVGDRLRLMHELWDGLVGEGYEPELTEDQEAELARRLADDDAAPDEVVPWDEVKAQTLARIRR